MMVNTEHARLPTQRQHQSPECRSRDHQRNHCAPQCEQRLDRTHIMGVIANRHPLHQDPAALESRRGLLGRAVLYLYI
jgi:hypothetical protein